MKKDLREIFESNCKQAEKKNLDKFIFWYLPDNSFYFCESAFGSWKLRGKIETISHDLPTECRNCGRICKGEVEAEYCCLDNIF